MAIELPRFEDTYCRIGSICSRVPEESSASLPQAPLDMTAPYAAGPGKALVRLLWDREKTNHFHMDFALRSAFSKNPPKTNTRLLELRKTLDAFQGISVAAIVHGYLAIPISSLPPTGGLIFVGNSGIRLRVNKSEIELTGASLTLRNAEVDHIRWELGKDLVYLDVYSYRSVTVNDSYLTDALRSMDKAVANYILGKKADDKPAV